MLYKHDTRTASFQWRILTIDMEKGNSALANAEASNKEEELISVAGAILLIVQMGE